MKLDTISTEEFRREGFVVLERALDDSTLALLQSEADLAVAELEASMTESGSDVVGLSHRGRRYFAGDRASVRPALADFVRSPLMEDICRATLGEEAYFYGDQFVVKLAEQGMSFAWHQDSGYLREVAPDYSLENLSCWIALDDMSEENGALWVLPFSRTGSREVVKHVADEKTNDFVGYFGDDPGVLVSVPAGSIVVFSTHLFHRSGANTTERPRRSWLVQYMAAPCFTPDGQPVGHNRPFLRGGRPPPA